MNKFELTNETTTANNVTLYRIKALKDFGNVKAGELGGFVEKLENLSMYGDCWIGGNALVGGNARVGGNALVCENAKVYENAVICGNALVGGDALVDGNALVDGWGCLGW